MTTENTFSWEARYSDLESDDTDVVSSSFSDSFDVGGADAELGDLVETDHDRPPLGSFVFGPAYDGTCFILKENLLYYCKPRQPELWPSLYYMEVSTPQQPLVTGLFHGGQPYVMSASEIYYVQGTGATTFFPLPMRARCGAQSARGAVSVLGKGIFHTGPDGIYVFGGGNDVKITEDQLEPIFRGETVEGLPGVTDMSESWLFVSGNYLYFGYVSEGYTYPTNVLVFNLETNRLSYYTYDDGAVVEIRAITRDVTGNGIVIGDNAGYLHVIESNDHTDDSGEPIAFEVQSKDYELQTRKHFPRWVKYDIDASGTATCTGSLILDGEVFHTHTISGDRDTKRRLVDIGNGNKSAFRISGTGTVSIYAIESE